MSTHAPEPPRAEPPAALPVAPARAPARRWWLAALLLLALLGALRWWLSR